MWGVCSSTEGKKTKIWYIPVYRKGVENKVNSDFLIPNLDKPELRIERGCILIERINYG